MQDGLQVRIAHLLSVMHACKISHTLAELLSDAERLCWPLDSQPAKLPVMTPSQKYLGTNRAAAARDLLQLASCKLMQRCE